jgi:autotransporter-associated beta strand protein
MKKFRASLGELGWKLLVIILGILGTLKEAPAAVIKVNYELENTSYWTPYNAGGDYFGNGTTELGMWANTGNTSKESVVWRTLKTAGDNTGSTRELQVGDVFTINLYASSAFGGVGFSLNDGHSTGSWANRISNSRVYVEAVGNNNDWTVKNGTTSSGLGYNATSTFKNYTFRVFITSESTANVQLLEGTNTKNVYDFGLGGTAGTNIDGFSLFLKDDWNGGSHQNIYWKESNTQNGTTYTTSVENLQKVELGYGLTGTSTFTPGLIKNGLEANSISTSAANEVFIGGASGTAVILNQNNTYTGLTTVNASATLEVQHANALGTTAAGTTVSNTGTLKLYHSTGLTVGAEDLTLNGDGNSSNGSLRSVGGNNEWQGALTLNSASRIGNRESGTTLTLSGGITVGSGNTLYLGGVNNPGNITVGGSFTSASNTSSDGAIFWDGSGTLLLNQATQSGLTGAINLRSGTVLVGADSALGTGATAIGAGSAVTLASADGNARSIGNNITLNNTLTLGQTSVGTGTLTLSGTFNLGGANRSVTVNAASTISGAVSNGSLTKAGSAQLTLTSDSSSFSTLTVNAGTVAIDGNTTVTGLAGSGTVSIASAKALTASMAADSTFSGVLSGAGGVTKTGSAILNLTGTSSSYTGTTAINGGTVTISGDGSLGGTTAPLSLGGGYLGFNGTFTLNSGRATTITAASSGFDVYGSQTLTYNGAIGESGAARSFDKKGTGTLILGGNNTYTGATTVSVGVARATSNTAFGTAAGGVTVSAGAAVQLSGGVTIGAEALTLNGAGVSNDGSLRNISGNNTWQGAISNSSGGRINSDADLLTISGNITNGSGQTLYIGGSGNTTVSGQITGSLTTGDGALFKNGTGTLTLSGDNSTTLTGNMVLRSGTVSVANANSLGSDGSIILGTDASSASVILNVSETTTRTGSLTVQNTSTGGVVEVASGKTFTISGVLDQTGGTSTATRFEKRGAGTLKLSGGTTGTYNGQIRISDGTLVAGSNGSLGDNTSTVTRALDLGIDLNENASANNARIDLANGVTLNQSMYVGANQGGATRTLGMEGGTGSATFQNEIYMGGNLTLDPGASGTLTVSGKITQNQSAGSQEIIKTGAGTVILSGTNDHKGGLKLNEGVLRLNSTTAAGSGMITQSNGSSTLEINTTGTITNEMSIYNVNTLQTVTLTGNKTLNNATYDVASGTTTTETGALSGTGGITKNGAGTLVVGGSTANTFSGASAVNAGTLKLEKTGGATAISGSSIAVNSGGTLLLGAANQIGNDTEITMSGGTLGMGGYNDTAGKLSVSANSIFDFGNTGAGTSTFTFSDFDTATYGGVAGLTMENVNIGSKIVFNVDYNGNSTFNSFTSKISFSNTQLMNQISFSGGTTTLTVAAIPEPRVYAAAAGLVLLIGWAEYKRRRGKKLGLSR